MGFDLEDCKSAYGKAKNKDIDTILDLLSEMQEKKKLTAPKVVEKTTEYNVYNCSVCTFLNDPPAKFCAICGTEAPATAIKVDLEAEKKKQEEEAKAKQLAEQKAQLLEQQALERAEKAKRDEEEKIRKLEQSKSELMDYFKDAKVLDFFFTSFNAGRSLTPLLSCAALFNSEAGKLDLHFAQFVYRPDYIAKFAATQQEFLAVLQTRQTAVECLYPLYVGQQLSKDYHQGFSRRVQTIMSPQLVGVARLNLVEITGIVQVGDDITDDNPIFFVIVGRDSAVQRIIVLKVESTKEISVVVNTEAHNVDGLPELH